jgi:hypothetical protein
VRRRAEAGRCQTLSEVSLLLILLHSYRLGTLIGCGNHPHNQLVPPLVHIVSVVRVVTVSVYDVFVHETHFAVVCIAMHQLLVPPVVHCVLFVRVLLMRLCTLRH